MAQEKDLAGADNLDFNFNIEDTHDAGENELDDFLNDEETVNGNTDGIIPKGTDEVHQPNETIPGAPKQNPKKNIPPVKSNTLEEKEAEAAKKKKEEEDAFNNYLDDPDLSEEEKAKAQKKHDVSPDSEDKDNLENEDEGIKSFAEELYKMKFFTKDSDDEEIPTTPDELIEKLQDEKQKGAEQLVDELAGRHGEEYREAFYAMFVNGVHPKDYLTKFSEIQSFKGLDMTDENNQVRVVETGLRKQGWEEEDITSEVQRLKNNSDLEAVSGRYHKALMKTEEVSLKKLEETAKINTERIEAADKQYYDNLNTILSKAIKEKDINGIPVTKELAQKAFNMAYVKKWTLPKSKEEITDLERIFLETKKPENHELRTQISLLFAQTFEGWEPGKKLTLDLSKIQKKAVSTESSELFHSLVRNKKQNGIAPNRKVAEEKYQF